ncbi:MAG: glyoxalase [Deltaproteobacteria bacterium]|nr:glyoxalase [Deltaproteobacteria bacterium]
MPTIKGLSHIVLYVNDLDKMVNFYTEVLGLVKYRVNAGRMVFLTSDPSKEDHELALTTGREGQAKLIAHIAWKVDKPSEVKEFYDKFKAQGVPIDHCVSHAYTEFGNTVSCYFLDPEGNRIEVYALVAERDDARINRKLDLDQSVDAIVAQASGLGVH